MTDTRERSLAAATAAAAAAPFQESKMPLRSQHEERRERRYPVISVDDHLVEPPHMFEGRLPRKYADRTPRVVETGDGDHAWLLDGSLLTQIGINAVVGQDRDRVLVEPTRFDHMRDGAWDIHARVADMDVDGVYASLCFPSLVGFAGVRLQGLPDRDFALAVVRAWNDWHLEEWVGTYPDRMIPCQIPWLNDAELAAAEIRSNARRGFKAVTFPELPGKLGFEPLGSRFWDPVWAACEDTGTVVCVHTGSSGLPTLTEETDGAVGTLFGAGYAMITSLEWLHARMAVRFPDLRICMSEGGIGWVAAILDRLDHRDQYRDATGAWHGELSAAEVFKRNFWFCTLDDPSAMVQRDRIGVENILFEVDYPHADTSWPDTQQRIASLVDGLPDEDAQRIAWRNASGLFDHPVPAAIQKDPSKFEAP